MGASFEQPVATGEITGLGLTRLLDAVHMICPAAKFYQASNSEMYGKVQAMPQDETTPFHPMIPYAAAKLYAHWAAVNYRQAYDMFVCCGILFNHESPLRGLEFVTWKITYSVARIKHGLQAELRLGNLGAKRDWGFAADYVEGMWLMMQRSRPDTFVLATGEQFSVRQFSEAAFGHVGLNCDDYVKVDERFFRPTDVATLLGNPAKAVKELGWDPTKTPFKTLVEMMVESDMKLVEREKAANMGFDEHQVRLFPHFME